MDILELLEDAKLFFEKLEELLNIFLGTLKKCFNFKKYYKIHMTKKLIYKFSTL
mgnify:CR=1 FL=1